MGKKNKVDSKENATKQDHLDPEEQKRSENRTATDDGKKKNEAKESSSETVDKEKYDELNNKFLRLVAEFDNFKKRTARERIELLQNAAKDTIADLLPILDDFDRAKKLDEDESSEESFSDGVELVYQKLHSTLRKKGLKAMASDGEVFDAELHEALTEVPAPSEELKGKVVDTIEKGYFLNDKIIRHAKVVVGK
jgi:molecular chaperone GrpE